MARGATFALRRTGPVDRRAPGPTDRRPEGERRPAFEEVFRASSEVRSAILFATLVIVLVFSPLLVLPGIEGRPLRPLGVAYLASLAGSLVVALPVTPVPCFMLLRWESLLATDEP